MDIKQRHMLKSKDVKVLKTKLIECFGSDNISQLFGNKTRIEWIKLENREELIVVNGILCFWFLKDKYIPLMSMLINSEIDFKMKTVEVDMGAIRFVTNGADIMRPGITEIDPEILKDDIIKIIDIKNKRPLAVGSAMLDAGDMEKQETGKVIKNIHTITDDIWDFSKQF
ncbi:MAG: DUF1947 domain-containing protein [archaeon]|nr:DUF1947 domain-containing protein [archaeon]